MADAFDELMRERRKGIRGAGYRMKKQGGFAGFWLRFFASLIDFVILYLLVYFINLLAEPVFEYVMQYYAVGIGQIMVGIFEAAGRVGEGDAAVGMLVNMMTGAMGILSTYLLFILVIGVLYFTLFLTSSWQATPGRRMMGIMVITDRGTRLSYLGALFRYFSHLVNFLAGYIVLLLLMTVFSTVGSALVGFLVIIAAVGFPFYPYLLVAWMPEKTGLHDLIAGTRVVEGRPDVPFSFSRGGMQYSNQGLPGNNF